MNLVKINNLASPFGHYDYKGLDMRQIVPGTQKYAYGTDIHNYCVLGTMEDLESFSHEDVTVITEEQYFEYEKELAATYPDEVESEETKIERLENENVELKLAMAELVSQQELTNLEIRMAMAELANVMLGGDE